MIDTHAHLDACADPPGDLLARARTAGVTRVVSVGSNVASSRATLAIAVGEEGVFVAVGIHPHEADEARPSDLDALAELATHPAVVAVGETGLDYFRDYAPRPRQVELFRGHAMLAAQLSKALVVHSRAAVTDTLDVLGETDPGVPVILHCFSEPSLLAPALERGYYLSFAGNVSFPKATELREAAGHTPAERILTETDSPYLAPQPVRGQPNEPAHVVHVLRTLAEVRGVDLDALERQIDGNASRAFSLP